MRRLQAVNVGACHVQLVHAWHALCGSHTVNAGSSITHYSCVVVVLFCCYRSRAIFNSYGDSQLLLSVCCQPRGISLLVVIVCKIAKSLALLIVVLPLTVLLMLPLSLSGPLEPLRATEHMGY